MFVSLVFVSLVFVSLVFVSLVFVSLVFVSLVFVSLVDSLFVATMRFQGTPRGGQLSSFPLYKYEKIQEIKIKNNCFRHYDI